MAIANRDAHTHHTTHCHFIFYGLHFSLLYIYKNHAVPSGLIITFLNQITFQTKEVFHTSKHSLQIIIFILFHFDGAKMQTIF